MNPQEILNELLNTEFKKVKERYGSIEIVWKTKHRNPLWMRALKLLHIKMEDRGEKMAWVLYSPLLSNYDEFFPIIYLNELCKGELLQNKDYLREILRHECLHLEMGFLASKKYFLKEAQRRNIIVKARDWNQQI